MFRDEIALKDRYQPVPRKSGFRMDGYFVWCGSCIKLDGMYHLFAARWPVETGFPDGYRQNSEIVRATADNPLGPYTFQEIVIPAHDPTRWNSGMAHNPVVYRAGSQFVLFHNGAKAGSLFRQLGMATADSIEGPWTCSPEPLDIGVYSDANNPAAIFEPDGSVKLIWRNKDLRVFISTAQSVPGPYTVANDNVWPDVPIEDFYFFKYGDKYHFICEDNVGGVSGEHRWGIRFESDNGINEWRKYDEELIVYDHDIRFSDGEHMCIKRRERPWLLVEDGVATCLFTAIYDGTNTWNQPVQIKPGYTIQ